MLHVICTQLRSGHLSVRVGDSSGRREEVVENLELRLSMPLIIVIVIIIIIIIIIIITTIASQGAIRDFL